MCGNTGGTGAQRGDYGSVVKQIRLKCTHNRHETRPRTYNPRENERQNAQLHLTTKYCLDIERDTTEQRRHDSQKIPGALLTTRTPTNGSNTRNTRGFPHLLRHRRTRFLYCLGRCLCVPCS